MATADDGPKGCVTMVTSELPARPGVAEAPAWRLPFSAGTWRRTLYVLLAPPVGIVAAPLALLGGYRAAAGWQRGLARRLLAARVDPAHRDTAGRVIAHALLGLPLDLGSLAIVAYAWSLVPLNLAYPLRPGTIDSYQHAWGGPTLAGAWAVHAAGGLVFLFAAPWIVKGVTWLQGRRMRRLLGAGR
jgi:hypothetical protein